MKKLFRIGSLFVVVLFCLVMTGCGSKDKVQEVSFEAQYIRSDGNVLDIKEPIVKKITSVKELNEYYNDNKENYNFMDNSVDSVSFATAIDKYDDKYFENSFLLLVILEEESGDIYHKVSSVKEDGNIVIERNLVDSDSNAVTDWHVIIEISRDYVDNDYKVKLKDSK